MNEKLLDIICCPVTHQPLHKADRGLLSNLNARIAAGDVHNAAGVALTDKLSAALVTRDGRRLYPVNDGMVALLADEAVQLEPAS